MQTLERDWSGPEHVVLWDKRGQLKPRLSRWEGKPGTANESVSKLPLAAVLQTPAAHWNHLGALESHDIWDRSIPRDPDRTRLGCRLSPGIITPPQEILMCNRVREPLSTAVIYARHGVNSQGDVFSHSGLGASSSQSTEVLKVLNQQNKHPLRSYQTCNSLVLTESNSGSGAQQTVLTREENHEGSVVENH